ncbi:MULTISPECIES: LPO_1073/Vpar_1526 family protein [Methylobacter]
MFSDKQEQKVDSNSTAIQAAGNVTVTNINVLPFNDVKVKELCLQFLRENFPALRDEAIKAAEENVKNFALQLELRISERSQNIVLEKFKDPDVQAAINDAVQATARKGKKANTNILVDLIAERVSLSSNEFIDIVLSEAILVTPKLTKEQISYLSFIHYMTHFSMRGLQHISLIEIYSKIVFNALDAGFNLSDSQKRHIQYAGTCSIATMMKVDIYTGWMKFYEYLGYTDINKFKEDIDVFCPITKLLLEQFEKDSSQGQVNLTSVGQAIAIANLATKNNQFTYSIWIKS